LVYAKLLMGQRGEGKSEGQKGEGGRDMNIRKKKEEGDIHKWVDKWRGIPIGNWLWHKK
jgi:hypothetical protein